MYVAFYDTEARGHYFGRVSCSFVFRTIFSHVSLRVRLLLWSYHFLLWINLVLHMSIASFICISFENCLNVLSNIFRSLTELANYLLVVHQYHNISPLMLHDSTYPVIVLRAMQDHNVLPEKFFSLFLCLPFQNTFPLSHSFLYKSYFWISFLLISGYN